MDIQTIRNTTGVNQQVIHKGLPFIIKPYAEENFAKDVAQKFLSQRSPAVQEVREGEQNFSLNPLVEQVWVANVSGNPKFEKTVTQRQLVRNKDGRKVWEDVSFPNTAAEAKAVVRTYAPGEVAFTGSDGSYMSKMTASYDVVIPIRKRVPLEKTVATWLFHRLGSGGVQEKQQVVASRPPTPFEPDFNWELDDIRAYLKLVSAGEDVDQGPSLDKLKAVNKTAKGAAFDDIVRKAKKEVLDRVYYYVVDPQYALPTRAEFDEFTTGKSAEEVSEEEAFALLDKAEKSLSVNS